MSRDREIRKGRDGIAEGKRQYSGREETVQQEYSGREETVQREYSGSVGTGQREEWGMYMEGTGNLRSKYEVVGDIAEDVLALMTELCQSGFDTVHDSTIQGMEQAVVKTRRYGMKYLSGLLEELAGYISAGRHQMERKTVQIAELYTQINEYLYLCRQKAAYDRGMERYAGTSDTEEALT